MNIILLTERDWLSPNIVRLTDRRLQHLIQVLKVAPGDSVRVGLLNGQRGVGFVKALSADAAELNIELTENAPPRHPYTLILALPRPKMLRRVLRTCAEFGVPELHLINTWRVEKSYWQSPLLSVDKINEALQAGLERSGDTVPPRVHLHKRFKPFVEDHLTDVAGARPIFIAHPGEHPSLPTDTGSAGVLMIGPEGGFIPYEVELAMANGAVPRSMGQRIFSVDTAVNALLARELG